MSAAMYATSNFMPVSAHGQFDSLRAKLYFLRLQLVRLKRNASR